MWHRVATVAETNRILAGELVAFALNNEHQYGIIVEDKEAKVSTWYVNDLVKDYRQTTS